MVKHYIVIADIAMIDVVMVYEVMANVVMVHIDMACTGVVYIVMAHRCVRDSSGSGYTRGGTWP